MKDMIKPEEAKFDEVFISPAKHKASGFQCVNVIVGDVSDEDIESIFGPLTGNEVFVKCDIKSQWGHLLKALSIFKSVSLARKNGWNKDIEPGFSEAVFKKQCKALFVLKEMA